MSNLINLRCPRQAGISKSRPDVQKTSRILSSSPLWRRMEHLVEHAYVARVDEPQFCPNGAVSISTPLSLAEILANSGPADLESDVSTGASNHTYASACDTAATEELNPPENEHSRDFEYSTANYSAGAPPHSSTLSDGLLPAPPVTASPGFAGFGFGLLSSIVPFDVLTAGHISHDGTRTWQPTPYMFPDPQIPSLISVEPNSTSHVWHDDSIAVDDHNRYDFVSFIERWRALKDPDPIVKAKQQLRDSSEAPSTLCFDDGAERDIQGLDWRSMGLDRNEALRGRHLLHPARQERMKPTAGREKYWSTAEPFDMLYRFRRHTPVHLAQPSHSQLRNLVASTGRSNIVYAAGTAVRRTSLACPLDQDTVIDLSASATAPAGVRVTCLSTLEASGQEIVLAGGFNGEYALSNLSLGHSNLTQGYVSHAYNGVVTHISTGLHRRSGRPQAVFSCNDQSLRVMDIETSRFTSHQHFDHPINCSTLSNDSRLRLAVGDCRDALLVDADTGETQASLHAHTDNIFACAWDPHGRHVATAAEDGRIVIWDPRSWKEPLHVRFAQMSSVRSLHFTEDGILFAAEDDDVISIYEPQRFRREQSIRFFGAIAGMALIDGGDEIIIANADTTVGGVMSFQRERCSSGREYDVDYRSFGFRHTQHLTFRHTEFDILP